MENFENELIEMFNSGNDNYYGEGERVEELWLDDEYNDRENYDDEFVDGWIDLKNRLRNGNIVNDEWDVEINFELRGEDILMWFIEGKEW
jgi:hypothetical protein